MADVDDDGMTDDEAAEAYMAALADLERNPLQERVAELEAALESIRDNSRDVEAVSIAASALAQKGDGAK